MHFFLGALRAKIHIVIRSGICEMLAGKTTSVDPDQAEQSDPGLYYLFKCQMTSTAIMEN